MSGPSVKGIPRKGDLLLVGTAVVGSAALMIFTIGEIIWGFRA